MHPRSAALSPTRLAEMTSVLRGHVERGELPGVVALVAREDTVHVDVLGTQGLVPAEKLDQLTTAYARDDATGRLEAWDTPADSFWSRPPAFPSGGGQGGLVSTADDLLAFCRMLLAGGQAGSTRLLSAASVQEMLTDQIPEEQKAASPFFPGFWDASGWGFGGAVCTKPDGVSPTAGRYGWGGGYGPIFFIDPRQDLTAILLMQRRAQGPDDEALSMEFSKGAYRALED